jgi:quinol monooxygenase YgiN
VAKKRFALEYILHQTIRHKEGTYSLTYIRNGDTTTSFLLVEVLRDLTD